jgi:hypothetical protein
MVTKKNCCSRVPLFPKNWEWPSAIRRYLHRLLALVKSFLVIPSLLRFGQGALFDAPMYYCYYIEQIQTPHKKYTAAMPVAAVYAMQRAADVRTSTLEKDNAVKESYVEVPSAAFYQEASTAATDVFLNLEHSVSAPPELGDRVTNLCASGIPFGARGTVVAIHDPAEGCVKVAMDEEFIGGSTFQGNCANFHGKLCIWNHLLKISAANSKGIVDNMLP